jgi:hypothetical protein
MIGSRLFSSCELFDTSDLGGLTVRGGDLRTTGDLRGGSKGNEEKREVASCSRGLSMDNRASMV